MAFLPVLWQSVVILAWNPEISYCTDICETVISLSFFLHFFFLAGSPPLLFFKNNQFSLLVVYSVKSPQNTEPFTPRRNTGWGSREPLVTTFPWTNPYIISFCVCFYLRTLNMCFGVINVELMANTTPTCAWRKHFQHTHSPQGTSQPPRPGNTAQPLSTALEGHLQKNAKITAVSRSQKGVLLSALR